MNDLEHLMSVHFNEDWSYAHPSWQAAADDFVARSPQRAARVPAQIDDLLRQHANDGGLAAALSELGCAFDPAFLGSTDRQWLALLRDHLLSAIRAN